MRNMRVFTRCIVLALLSIWGIGGCGLPWNSINGGGGSDRAAQDFASLLPAPAAAAKLASAAGLETIGSDYDSGLPSNRVAAQPPDALLSPDFNLAGAHAFGGLSYCVYSFYTFKYYGEPRVSLDFTGSPPEGVVWVGLANFTRGRWDWFQLPASHELSLASLSDYRDGFTLLAAVAVTGTDPVRLSMIRLGERLSGYYETEDNDTYDQANALPAFPFPAPVVNGSIGAAAGYDGYDGDTQDWYVFTLAEPGALAFRFALAVKGGTGSYVHFDFKRDDGTGQPKDWRGWGVDANGAYAMLYFPAAGTYWLRVDATDVACDYSIEMDFSPAALYETEDNDSFEQADPLPELPVGFGAVFGSVGTTDTPDTPNGEVVYDGDAADWYSFSVPERTLAAVELRCLGYSSTDHQIIMPDGTTVLASKIGVHTPDRTVVMLPVAGTYYIKVLKSATSTHTNYFLTVETGSDGLGWLNVPAYSQPDGESLDDCSLALVDGRPAIAFIRNGGAVNVLAYTRALDAEGSAWGTPVFLDLKAGFNISACSLAVVNGNPAIGFSTEGISSMSLGYLRASDAQGGAWDNSAVVVDSSDEYVGSSPSLAVVNGNPALSYYVINTAHALRYARATDADGTAWSAPVDVAPSASANTYLDGTSLCVVNGNPGIAYIAPAGGLRFVRATDADGAAWATPVAAFSAAGHTPVHVSLAIVGARPAIAFDTKWSVVGNGNHIRFVRATDLLGEVWGTALDLVVEGDSFTAEDPSLALISGKPAIAYRAGQLSYIAATDNTGSAWGLVEVPDDTVGAGYNPSLANINGKPGIAHRIFAETNLLYCEKF